MLVTCTNLTAQEYTQGHQTSFSNIVKEISNKITEALVTCTS